MSSYYEIIKMFLKQLSCDEIFVASELKQSQFCDIPDNTYYKSLERMVKEGKLIHLTKGLYSRTAKNQEQIVAYYTAHNSGIVVGERLFCDKGFVTGTTESVNILSNQLKEERKHIGNVEVQKIHIDLNESTIPIVETLEILQDYTKIENINKNRFLAYMRGFSENYSDDLTHYVIGCKKYKKSTIAFLERILTWYGVENSLKQHLSPLSDYKIPTIDELRGSIPTKMQDYLREYVSELKKIYQDNLDRVILYGSYARGDFRDDSDVDIMILLRISDMEIKSYGDLLSQLTYDFNTNYDLDIKPIAKNRDEFSKWVKAYPFYANIEREGVELFGAA